MLHLRSNLFYDVDNFEFSMLLSDNVAFCLVCVSTKLVGPLSPFRKYVTVSPIFTSLEQSSTVLKLNYSCTLAY